MKPIIIVGAARSGTNMLRDILTTLPDMGTWDCDEINPIWKHLNIDYKYDDIPKNLANDRTKKFIRKKFNEISKKTSKNNIIEKTCANSLRLPFVDSILPDAKYLIIIRNGYDASISANLRWSSKLDIKYTLKKLRYVPISDIPYYAWRYGKNRIKQFLSKDGVLKVWGPTFPELLNITDKYNSLQISAYQWSESVKKTITALKNISSTRYHIISYEKFTKSPDIELLKILKFLEYPYENIDINELTKNVSSKSVGSASRKLKQIEIDMISPIIETSLKKANSLL